MRVWALSAIIVADPWVAKVLVDELQTSDEIGNVGDVGSSSKAMHALGGRIGKTDSIDGIEHPFPSVILKSTVKLSELMRAKYK